MIYAVYDISADTWYMLGAYPTSTEVIEFYRTMCQAPFWKDRLSALYVIGSFDMDTGFIAPCEKSRILMSGKSVSEITSVSEDHNSGGAGGELSPQKSKEGGFFQRLQTFFHLVNTCRDVRTLLNAKKIN